MGVCARRPPDECGIWDTSVVCATQVCNTPAVAAEAPTRVLVRGPAIRIGDAPWACLTGRRLNPQSSCPGTPPADVPIGAGWGDSKRGASPFRPQDVALEAGRLTLARLDALALRRRSFAFESTLASQSLARRLLALRDGGYTVHVVYLWLPSVDLALARVAERVRAGGHDVQAEVVRRRYERGRDNFFTHNRMRADRWRVYDASRVDGPRLVAAGGAGVATRIRSARTWRMAAEGYHDE